MLPYLLIVLAFGADRLSKLWAADYLADNGATQINSFINLQPAINRGIAFGMLQGVGPAIGWLSIGIVVGLLVYLVRAPKRARLLRIGLALIIGGALGNLVDRVTTGQVLDFIQIPLRPGIFNVADVMIQAGVVFSLLGTLFRPTEAETKPLLTETGQGPST